MALQELEKLTGVDVVYTVKKTITFEKDELLYLVTSPEGLYVKKIYV